MKNILGIDYGRSKVGLALSTESKLATPYKVLRVSSVEEAIDKISIEVEEENIDRLVVGVSEGKMAEETKIFANALREKTKLDLHLQDETLTTQDAQELSIDAGINRKVRRQMEDAYSAALILQKYLDEYQ
jgi:putative Holliday junction resolvase